MVHFEDKVNYLCQINIRCGIIWRIRENGVFHRENRFSALSLGKGIFFIHTLGRISSFRIYWTSEEDKQVTLAGTVTERSV